jgi:hypothetical protein
VSLAATAVVDRRRARRAPLAIRCVATPHSPAHPLTCRRLPALLSPADSNPGARACMCALVCVCAQCADPTKSPSECGPGRYAPSGSAQCILCDNGYFCGAGSVVAAPPAAAVAAGRYYNPVVDGTVVNDCPAGAFHLLSWLSRGVVP